jgi:hypothetical protein
MLLTMPKGKIFASLEFSELDKLEIGKQNI